MDREDERAELGETFGQQRLDSPSRHDCHRGDRLWPVLLDGDERRLSWTHLLVGRPRKDSAYLLPGARLRMLARGTAGCHACRDTSPHSGWTNSMTLLASELRYSMRVAFSVLLLIVGAADG